MLVSESVGQIENDEEWRREPHGPSINVIAHCVHVGIHMISHLRGIREQKLS